ncbi:MAG: TolC family protein [Longimicrobiales bacterium]
MHTISGGGGVFMAAIVLMTTGVSAQEPVLIGTPEMTALRELQQTRNPLLAARRSAVDAARIRNGGVQSIGPITFFFELEEASVGEPGNHTLRAGVEHEFTARGQAAADRARTQSQLRVAQAELVSATVSNSIDLEQHAIESAVWDRIRARLIVEDSLLVRASATLNARFAAGTARYVDVVRMRTERLRVQAEAARALARAEAARQHMAGSVGTGANDLIPAAIASIRDLPVPVLPAVDEMSRVSPALALADAQIATARADLASARVANARRWSAGVGLQRFDGVDGYTLGPLLLGSVTLPVPERSVRQALVSAATRDTLTVVGLRAAILTRLGGDVSAAETRFAAARQQFEAIDQRLLSAAREERESALIGYAAGELSLLELLDFERALARAEIQRLESYLEMIDVWTGLWRTAATGGHEETRS